MITMLILGLLTLSTGVYLLRNKGKLAEAVDEHFAAKHRGKELEKRKAELEVQRESTRWSLMSNEGSITGRTSGLRS